MTQAGKTMEVNGVIIYYEVHGCPTEEAKPVLIFVHGYLSSLFSFRFLYPHLAHSYTIYALDLPGFGDSEKSKTFHYSLENYGRLILSFMDQLTISRAVLIGHSMGGQICLNTARQSPGRIQKVIGLSVAGYMGRVNKKLKLATYLPFSSYLLRYYMNKNDVTQQFSLVVYNRSAITQDMMEAYLKPLKRIDFYHSLKRLARHREGDMNAKQLSDIKQPVLLLWGKEDKVVPLKTGERFLQDLPNAQLQAFDETGHLLPEERPQQVSAAINRFLS
ncbi:alpha/beta fold hydrolase [Tuberibacillus sp. Marseille-P3662]|uniref:alpha/beta fold hydrolase n=1 Tax=Tuberibacillus sp. Marseille-P3662 TaxID=1965358 RepID=UPI000A1CA9FB|nr:alpha/beta hydrolase [Tuberibacillus sp. Marseille-P3662]